MTYKKYFVVNEILETEQSYVNYLKELVVEYLDYWRHTSILPNENCLQLFGNVPEIYEFSKTFLNELQVSSSNNVSEVAQCFLNNRLKFIVYFPYCINFENSNATLSEVMRSRHLSNIVNQRQNELGHRLPLGSYLALPVQRILRYHLLLKKLAAYTSDKTAEQAVCIKAYEKMALLAKIIDETKNKHEKKRRVDEIRSTIERWKDKTHVELAYNCFELIAEGNLTITGTKKKIHVILLNNALLIAKENKSGLLEYRAHILNENIIIIEKVQENPLSFCLVSNAKSKYTCTLQASFMEEKTFWVKVIKDVKDGVSDVRKSGFAKSMAENFYVSENAESKSSLDCTL